MSRRKKKEIESNDDLKSIQKKEENLAKIIDRAVFPGMQGGPHMNTIAGMAIAFEEASGIDFPKYAENIVRNSERLCKVDLDGARRRSLADHKIELEILHGWIENFFNCRAEAMDLVDEEHIALFKIGELRGQITCLGNHRAGGRAKVHAQLTGDNLRERCLAKPGWADKQHVVQRVTARLGCFDEDLEIFTRRFLAGEIRQNLRTQRSVKFVVANLGVEQAAWGQGHQISGYGVCGLGAASGRIRACEIVS